MRAAAGRSGIRGDATIRLHRSALPFDRGAFEWDRQVGMARINPRREMFRRTRRYDVTSKDPAVGANQAFTACHRVVFRRQAVDFVSEQFDLERVAY